LRPSFAIDDRNPADYATFSQHRNAAETIGMQAAARQRKRARPLNLSVHRRSVARLLAVLALVVHGIAGLSPLWVGTVERSGFEICTANGLRIAAAVFAPAGTPADRDAPSPNCLLCTLHAAAAVVPAACALQPVHRGGTMLGPPDLGCPALKSFAGFDHLCRAPPVPA
jgi:hypothetical protein